MKIYQFYRRQALDMKLDEAWDFFTSPYNLNQITPDFFHVSITSKVPERIYSGLMISYKMVAVFGLPMDWLSEVSHCDEYKRFVYEQRVGPFKFLSHEVALTPLDKGVVMEDIIFYVMPFGWFGRLFHRLLIGRKLNQIFDTRRDYLHARWGSPE
ncbi:SRPBCC family protein [Methylicorpusculum sp.]|uniref:SRPBCC family protein n=1 Tax=Methylicorpusculum sp. TaxID=2713644 RepID=UPI00271829E4|nr:SRPBCC family protein [Methylicorpusculum sp.]MDO9241457.1 SRPBCC family protein [Methylicorpusculum sp.]MDP2179928.1 SRPBCC family protein [Methylicorpusculum sp.]MDP3528369.1 SRPBCC family protein [Methylicorpusculum sp.]MDZ4154153.1 SRPBCC family protein [Methylicorpusculum sp.]